MGSLTQPMDPKGETGKLCNWVHDVTLDDVPSEVITRAKFLLLDGIACAITGAHLPWSEKAAKAIFSFEPPGSAQVFGWEKVNTITSLLSQICSQANKLKTKC